MLFGGNGRKKKYLYSSFRRPKPPATEKYLNTAFALTRVQNMSNAPTEHKKRLDFYWQFTSIYTFALVVYIFAKGLISDDRFSAVLSDPFVYLLGSFVLLSVASLIVQLLKRHVIIISEDSIVFLTRRKEKRYQASDIVRIIMRKERTVGISQRYKLVKIKVNGRKRYIRVRPSSFTNDKQFVAALLALKSTIDGKH